MEAEEENKIGYCYCLSNCFGNLKLCALQPIPGRVKVTVNEQLLEPRKQERPSENCSMLVILFSLLQIL